MPSQLEPGAAVFYGVTPETAHLWRQAVAEGRDWYYIDNSYFDASRGTYYRITRNRLQHDGRGASNGTRFEALGVPVRPWRDGCGHQIVVCLQSPMFMETVAGVHPREWQKTVQQVIAARPELRVVVRDWHADKKLAAATLDNDLRDAALLLTWGSAAAVEALLAGVPVHVGPQSAAYGIAPPFRRAWANVLADNQWTVDEIRNGTAWRDLCKRAG